jgi:mRNA interferase RelE/StbE
MKKYSINYTSTFEKQFRKLDKNTQQMIANFISRKISNLINPRLEGKALKGSLAGIWSYRVSNYRILAKIDDEKFEILAINVGHRKSI